LRYITRVRGNRFGNQSDKLAEMREAGYFVSPLRAGEVALQLLVQAHGDVHTFGEVSALAPDSGHGEVAGVALVPRGDTGGYRKILIDEDVQTARVAVGVVASAQVLEKHAETHS
jgi:hypothetical protein